MTAKDRLLNNKFDKSHGRHMVEGRGHTFPMTVLEGRENDQPDIPAPDAPPEGAVSGNIGEAPRDLPDDVKQERRDAIAEARQQADGVHGTSKFEAPRGELARFNPERAGLPATSPDAVAEYLAEHRAARPWLAVADKTPPEVQRIIVALDSAGGHAHIRHEGWVTEEANRRRIEHWEDPAQLDPLKRSSGIDAFRPGEAPHRCGDTATRIKDPIAFATAIARGTLHSEVRGALELPFDGGKTPSAVAVPIADLLGPDGHRYCTGWRLQPTNGSIKETRLNRDAWIMARESGREPDVPKPDVGPVPTFEGGDIIFAFTRNYAEQQYEVVTTYPRPPQPSHSQGAG